MDVKEVPGGALTIVLGVIIIGIMCFFIFLQASSLRTSRESVRAEKQAVKQLQAELEEALRLEREEPNIKADLEKTIQRIPAAAKEDMIIKELIRFSDHAGLGVAEFSVDKEVPKTGYTEVPFKLTVKGRYAGIVDLLENIGEGRRLMRVDEVKISKESGDNLALKAEIKASAFYSTGQPVPGLAATGQ